MPGCGREALSLGTLRGAGWTAEGPGDMHDQSRDERDRGWETLERSDIEGVVVDETHPAGFRNLMRGRPQVQKEMEETEDRERADP